MQRCVGDVGICPSRQSQSARLRLPIKMAAVELTMQTFLNFKRRQMNITPGLAATHVAESDLSTLE